jgi:hypothetical protein
MKEKEVDHKTKITYRDFYDVPRMIVVTHRGLKLLLDCKFEESLDDYSTAYRVSILPQELDELSLHSWGELPRMATKYLGDIPIAQVVFDPSKRAEIDTAVLDSLLGWKLGNPETGGEGPGLPMRLRTAFLTRLQSPRCSRHRHSYLAFCGA